MPRGDPLGTGGHPGARGLAHDAAAAGFDDALFHEVLRGERDLPRVLRVLEDEAQAPFHAWNAKTDRQAY